MTHRDYCTPMSEGSVARFHNAKPPRNLAKQQRGDKGGVRETRETLRNPAKPRETCETPRNHLCETAKPLRNLAKQAVKPCNRPVAHRGTYVSRNSWYELLNRTVALSHRMRIINTKYVFISDAAPQECPGRPARRRTFGFKEGKALDRPHQKPDWESGTDCPPSTIVYCTAMDADGDAQLISALQQRFKPPGGHGHLPKADHLAVAITLARGDACGGPAVLTGTACKAAGVPKGRFWTQIGQWRSTISSENLLDASSVQSLQAEAVAARAAHRRRPQNETGGRSGRSWSATGTRSRRTSGTLCAVSSSASSAVPSSSSERKIAVCRSAGAVLQDVSPGAHASSSGCSARLRLSRCRRSGVRSGRSSTRSL